MDDTTFTRNQLSATVGAWVASAPRAIFCVGTYGGLTFNQTYYLMAYEAYANTGLFYGNGMPNSYITFPSVSDLPSSRVGNAGYCPYQSLNTYCSQGVCLQ